jgi:hypothetical protein
MQPKLWCSIARDIVADLVVSGGHTQYVFIVTLVVRHILPLFAPKLKFMPAGDRERRRPPRPRKLSPRHIDQSIALSHFRFRFDKTNLHDPLREGSLKF